MVAFVDGELDPTAARDVARLIAMDPAAQEKVRLLRRSAILVRAAFSGTEWEQVPPRLVGFIADPGARRKLRGRRQLGMAIAASAAIAGLAGGFGVQSVLAPRPGPAMHLINEVAEYHTVFARYSRGLGIVPASAAPLIEAWFSDVLGRRLNIPDLRSFNLDFHGARLLVVDNRPVTQLLYAARSSSSGMSRHLFGVCSTAWPDHDQPLTIARRDEVRLALWASDGYA